MSMIRRGFLFVMILVSGISNAYAQQLDSLNIDPVQVLARPNKDSIVLRWAPVSTSLWLQANKQGYIIERYTLVREGKALSQPEKKILTPVPVKPYGEADWQKIVGNNKYTIIAAQALLGESFELDMRNNGSTASIVNKVSENDQRFSIALFCADMSLITAKALGLYYADKQVVKGEKYLYRIISGPAETSTLKGSIFVSPDDPYKLIAPLKFSVEAKEKTVQLQWNQSYNKRVYTTYRIERSEDGKTFKPISNDPVVSLPPYGAKDTDQQYAVDTLPQLGKDYHYRVLGVTPFGDAGPPSEIKVVKGDKVLNDLPFITSALTVDNKTITLEWNFPSEYNPLIDGFLIERSNAPNGTFNKIHDGVLNSTSRAFTDGTPKQTNYYRIAAQTTDKKLLKSSLYYAQLVDSVPPSTPVDLKGTIDDMGNVQLSWKPNSDNDIYGYRIYRSYYKSEEFTQITSGPISDTKFNDRVDVQSLNDKIHYRLMAIDNNQNHSPLSDIFSIDLPDKLPPVTPAFLPVTASNEGVTLSWLPSPSTDVAKYDLYRKLEDQWIRLTSMPAGKDTVYSFTDTNLNNDERQYYTLIAVDDANLESTPSPVVFGQKIKRSIWPEVKINEPVLNRESKNVKLQWTYDYNNVEMYQIYRGKDKEPLKLYRSVATKEFTDRMVPGEYEYRVVAVFKDGSKSAMGKGVTITF